MPVLWLILIIFALAVAGYFAGRVRAISSVGGNSRNLHSLPNYYGWNVAMKVMTPALLALVIWLLAQPFVVNNQAAQQLPQTAIPEGSTLGLVMSDVRRVADGLDLAVSRGLMGQEQASSLRTEFTDVRERLAEAGIALGSNVSPDLLRAAQTYRSVNATGGLLMTVVVLALAAGGLALGVRESQGEFRARNAVEKGVRALLLAAASIAVLTTIGIVLSLIFNTVEFFRVYPAAKFFGSFTWSPSFGGGSELGIWPLLWGTFYISLIALLVSVPIGLFAAVYLSEYAGPKLRAWAKPLLELLAGIPTIVYGLFALLTVGPLLLEVFGREGLGWMQSGTAVMTAGLVMGIMLIPFVSSLSDDIINSVPQSLRDGSYGLGATKSETIREVILPAALPGIVGAVLLAASRAIGETMIVVLGAGAAARLSLNPFDAMTTVTAKIVSQLTGDADFSSPEALVAFALGMTLFVMTLGLNVFALYIVRKYREQYD
ncbi:phosphate ABC transporter permease subunit PstC [Salipiger marinus]|jgi:phosphate transport system permease protein|uniref:Phosphate transport system permease protein n=1 Tax=Salipiger marinus TaxID=555512 RepID=A0A1G8PCW5_9RHOB|nr:MULTISPECIES: phosphate ABC transporter permease subunit PstC [Salipiger]HBM57602.1 phosphate ABC transporter permease subunit PstC [Citreicella sp.]MCD1618918.1 phosphate ABC transporter permease subunit PstC [Salipiger manganoxidans]MEB3419828.1 phosphate ABC transporter permease subunit PstC [Salipiger manganoxidans]SDI90125.1 phosphate ABC transporter membrane protein 1, PhoT family [Salipiger marinus]HBT02255.1 phosphate ABC transporter permease subunit PstC [Citreicella sp.]